jgi:16S rRNA (uracil1498-N3)-methyltransferase
VKHRLHLPELREASHPVDERITLKPEQGHYLNRVLRLGPGDGLAVFDGAGREWQGTLSRERRQMAVEVGPLLRSTGPAAPLVLIQAWLKGAAMDTVVQKATELGATAVWLLKSDRSNLKLDAARLDAKLAHLARVVGSAAEQCDTLWTPALQCPDDLAAAFAAAADLKILFLDPGAPPLALSRDPEPLAVAVGPEGGWTETERGLAGGTANVISASLGELTLRAETAPLAALAAIRHGWGWRRSL